MLSDVVPCLPCSRKCRHRLCAVERLGDTADDASGDLPDAIAAAEVEVSCCIECRARKSPGHPGVRGHAAIAAWRWCGARLAVEVAGDSRDQASRRIDLLDAVIASGPIDIEVVRAVEHDANRGSDVRERRKLVLAGVGARRSRSGNGGNDSCCLVDLADTVMQWRGGEAGMWRSRRRTCSRWSRTPRRRERRDARPRRGGHRQCRCPRRRP